MLSSSKIVAAQNVKEVKFSLHEAFADHCFGRQALYDTLGPAVAMETRSKGKRRWGRGGSRVHPVTESQPSPEEESCLHQSALSESPRCSHGRLMSTPTSQSAPAPTGGLGGSLAPLLGHQLRKGGQRASPTTDWSSCGAAELERCLPLRQMRVFVGTWNMQRITVSLSLQSHTTHTPLTHSEPQPAVTHHSHTTHTQ